MYNHIKKAYGEIYSIISAHKELGIDPKGLDDIPAVIYTVADLVAFSVGKDRDALYDTFLDWLFSENYDTSRHGSQNDLNEYIANRIVFYTSLNHRDVVGLWVTQNRLEFERIIQNNPIKRIVAAFIDCLIDPAYIDDYDCNKPWIEIDYLRSLQIASTLSVPLFTSLEVLAKAVVDTM